MTTIRISNSADGIEHALVLFRKQGCSDEIVRLAPGDDCERDVGAGDTFRVEDIGVPGKDEAAADEAAPIDAEDKMREDQATADAAAEADAVTNTTE